MTSVPRNPEDPTRSTLAARDLQGIWDFAANRVLLTLLPRNLPPFGGAAEEVFAQFRLTPLLLSPSPNADCS
jgi:hypothetical protein